MNYDWRARLVVSDRKITGYLLSFAHPAGRSKAALFTRFGFSVTRPAELRDALLHHASDSPVYGTETTEFGRKYTVVAVLPSPDGRNPLVRSIWFEEAEGAEVTLVTAYPAGGRR